MDQAELLNFVVDAMERHKITYAVTGSQASSAYGEQRFTNDIDIIVNLRSQPLLDALLAEFPPDEFYVSDMGARHAIAGGGQFNIIHQDTSQKVDVIVPVDPNWPDQLARRISMPVSEQRNIWFTSAEDLILKKMDFYREGGSDKHLRDIAGMLKISGDQIDRAYIEHWSQQLGLAEIWHEIAARVGTVK